MCDFFIVSIVVFVCICVVIYVLFLMLFVFSVSFFRVVFFWFVAVNDIVDFVVCVVFF